MRPMAASSIVPSAASVTAAPGRDDRPVADPALDLLVGAAGARRGSGSGPRRAARSARPRSRTGRGGTRSWRAIALAAGPADHRLGAQHVADGGEVLGRVGLAERAADGAAVAHDGVGDHPLGVGDDREEPGDLGGLQQRRRAGSARRRAAVALAADEVELGQVVDVDQPLGPGQPELHHRQQAVPAGDDPRLGAVAFEQRRGRRRRCVARA